MDGLVVLEGLRMEVGVVGQVGLLGQRVGFDCLIVGQGQVGCVEVGGPWCFDGSIGR